MIVYEQNLLYTGVQSFNFPTGSRLLGVGYAHKPLLYVAANIHNNERSTIEVVAVTKNEPIPPGFTEYLGSVHSPSMLTHFFSNGWQAVVESGS